MATDKSKYYLSNEDFFTEVIKSRIDKKISPRLVEMFTMLSQRTINHRNFVRYEHLREDFTSIGILACVYSFEKFRPYKCKERSINWEKHMKPIGYNYLECNNCFAFFTTCIMNALIQYLKDEYKEINIINSMRSDEGLGASYGYDDMIRKKEGLTREYEEPSEAILVDKRDYEGYDPDSD